jgi:hypothetical protein
MNKKGFSYLKNHSERTVSNNSIRIVCEAGLFRKKKDEFKVPIDLNDLQACAFSVFLPPFATFKVTLLDLSREC